MSLILINPKTHYIKCVLNKIRIGLKFCVFLVKMHTQPGVYNISSDETGRNLTFGLGQEIKERKDYMDIRELRSLIRNIQLQV